MVKKKTSVNQNFEALKAQMQAKRKLAENKFEQDKTINVTPIKEVSKEDDEEYITLNIIDDEDIEEDVQVETITEKVENPPKVEVEIEKENQVEKKSEPKKEIENQVVSQVEVLEPVTVITPVSKKAETTPDINMNRIVLKKVEKQEAPKRITYYLKPETIKKIDKFSKAAGMGKSEFVQTILDEILNNLEIEK